MTVIAILIGFIISLILAVIGAHLVLDNYDPKAGMVIAIISALMFASTVGLGIIYYKDVNAQPAYSKRRVFDKSEELYTCYPRAFSDDRCTLIAVKYNKTLKTTEEYEVVENPKWEKVYNN